MTLVHSSTAGASIPTAPLDDPWAELETLARAASPGPWIRSGCRRKMGDEDCIMVGPDGFLIAALPIGQPRDHAGAFKDAAFIAAANPAAVLKLIEAARPTAGGDEGEAGVNP